MNRRHTLYALLGMFLTPFMTGSLFAQGTNAPQAAPATKFGLPVAKPATASPTTPITATAAAPVPSSAPPPFGVSAYIQIEGAKQGQFKGEVTRKGSTQWIPVAVIASEVEHEVESPRDAGSGLPTGRRMYKPITIAKEWGAASPQFQRSLTEHEALRQVVIEFVRTGPQGKEQVYRTVTLTNAFVTRIQKRAASLAGRSDKMVEQEEIELTFQSIEWNDPRPATSGSQPE